MRKLVLILAGLMLLAGCVGTAKSENGSAYAENENLRIVKLEISGMTCPSCAAAIEYKLKQKAGIVEARVSYSEGNGEVMYDTNKISKEEIIAAIKPYTARIVEEKEVKE